MNLLTILFFVVLSLTGFCNGFCIERERQALLKLKQGLIDPADHLASWVANNGDCCMWKGVVCHNLTGHVLQLHLSAPTHNLNIYDSDGAFHETYVTSQLSGKISPSLLHLSHLSYLNLSYNDFRRIQIPKFFGSLKSLKYLDLKMAGFDGKIPPHLGNLSNLEYLNLDSTGYVENFHWLSGLPLLEHLDLSFNDLSLAFDWFHSVNTLPSLVVLYLAGSQLPQFQVGAFPSVNLSSLAFLDLHQNNFQYLSTINWVFGVRNLVFLDLSKNKFESPIPYGLQNLTFLKYLDLSFNYFNSSIPDWLYSFSPLENLNLICNNLQGQISNAIGEMNFVVTLFFSATSSDIKGKIPRSVANLCNLRSISFSGVNLSQEISDVLEVLSGCVSNALEWLDLSNCQLSGQLNQLGNFKNLRQLFLSGNNLIGNLPKSFGQLAKLIEVDISQNCFEGTVSGIHFRNLTKLKYFVARSNSFILKVKFDWVPPFQTQVLFLGGWHLGPQFPKWLQFQKNLKRLGMSGSKISDTIPDWFFEMSSQYIYLNLSHNQIQGQLPNILHGCRDSFPTFDLSSNNFTGPLPLVSSSVSLLDLSNNGLSGSITYFLCYRMNKTMVMEILNLSDNTLSGELPNCWTKWPLLNILILANNRYFSGGIPSSIGTLKNLRSLHLRENRLSGEIPLSLRNCSLLQILDLSENELDGNLQPWIGISLTNLKILSLRSNKFWGHIPNELCALNSLKILDFAHNNLSGHIPRCVGNLSAMVMEHHSSGQVSDHFFTYSYVTSIEPSSLLFKTYPDENTYFLEDVIVVKKGQLLDYNKTLDLVKVMDFSSNNLTGEVPSKITNLTDLQSLNLSHNFLSGRIPGNIGNMGKLESLDLSGNELSGPIPQSMSSLTFLSCLNLSENQLSGRIPSSTQLQSFDASSYAGNKLCGLPLMDNCNAIGSEPRIQNGGGQGEDHGEEINWFFVTMALGFIVGFWSFLGPLVINRRWRCRYYQFLNEMWWKISDFVCKCF